LALGSGFYESPTGKDEIPSVLKNIVDMLRNESLLTQRPRIDVYVNPKACQAVAHSMSSFTVAGWRIREARQPDFLGVAARTLHAKFIFSANDRDNSPYCNSAWLYLGSGNLTAPGFANPMSAHGGNLEAGVVIAPESLRWFHGKHVEPKLVLTNLLPLQWDNEIDQASGALETGKDMPEPQVQFVGAPVSYFHWVPCEDAGRLQPSQETAEAFQVLDGIGQACHRDTTTGFLWPGPRPREVTVRWQAEGKEWLAAVPVVDEFGRIAATILPALGIDEAWGQLANFPLPPEDEEQLQDDQGDLPGGSAQQGAGGDSWTARYPVRQMMQLIENIAAKQTSVSQPDWVTWCTRLEQCLIQMKGSTVLEEFLKLRLNPLSPLWHAPFRPGFATTAETQEGSSYQATLGRIETAWNVAALARLEGQE
jgi:hypothetical protein